MAFATTTDVGDRLGRALTDAEVTSVEFLLDAATAVIAEAADENDAWAVALSPVPTIVRVICVELVCRALANPNSLDSLQETLGQHSYSARFREDAGLWLTPREENLIRRATGATRSGSTLVRSIVGDQETVNEALE